jgi:tetratricopeptide (TPR) repeat protein
LQEAAEQRTVRPSRHSVGECPSRLVQYFKDRQRQRADLRRLLLDDPDTRMVSIVGRGGGGKTALASRVLADMEAALGDGEATRVAPRGILYLSTRTAGITLERIFHDAAHLVGGERESMLVRVWTNSVLPMAERIDRLVQELSDGTYVFLLDNLEKLLSEDGRIADEGVAGFVEAVLKGHGRIRLLITTRMPLRLSRDLARFNRVISLDEGLPTSDAVTILRELDPNNEYLLRDAPDEKLAEAAARVYGLPRALEVLVGLLDENKFLTIDEVLPQFYREEAVIETLVEASNQRLDQVSQRALQALAVFERPVPPVAVDFMLATFHPGLDIAEVLRRLERVQMIGVNRSTKRCYLHPIDRELAYSALPEEGEYSRVGLERRAAEYYHLLRMPRDRWRKIEDLEPHLEEFEHLLRAGDAEAAAAVLCEIDVPWLIWSGYAERVLAMWTRLDGRIHDSRLQMPRAYALGHVHLVLGPFAEAEVLFREAFERAKAQGEEDLARDSEGLIGETLRRMGRYEEAEPYVEEIVSEYRKAGNIYDEARWLLMLSLLHTSTGDLRRAMEESERALVLARESGNPWLEARAHNGLSLVYLRQRRSDAAEQHARQGLELYRAANATDGPPYLYNMIGVARLQAGDVEGAMG